MTRRFMMALVLAAAVAVPAAQQQDQTADINARIRKEGMDNSQIMRTMHQLTDVYGPRLTGSPNHKAAGEWAIKEMARWGFTNGHLEPFDFGRPGWLNEKASGHIVAPVKDNLVFEVLAWTPSTNGTARGAALQFELPEQPTQAELHASYVQHALSTDEARTHLVKPFGIEWQGRGYVGATDGHRLSLQASESWRDFVREDAPQAAVILNSVESAPRLGELSATALGDECRVFPKSWDV